MKVHLIYPPLWLTDVPYLSVPALRAYLERLPQIQVESFDLNIQLWIHLRSEESLAEIHAWAMEKLNSFGKIHSREDLDAVLRLRSITAQDIEGLIEKVRSRSIPVPVLQSCIKMFFKEAIMNRNGKSDARRWQQDRHYHDPYMNSISMSEYADSADRLLDSLDPANVHNPYLGLMPQIYRQLSRGDLPDLLAVSVTAANQTVPALALSQWVRKAKPQCKIIWGGQWVTHVLDQAQELAPLFDIVDGMIAGEGEVPLEKLIEAEKQGLGWDDVPNLFRRISGEVVPPLHIFQAPNLDHLPTPNFEGIPLDEFDYPTTLPLQTSRGCSWNRCRFCSYVILDPVYKKRSASQVVDDMEAIIARHGVEEIAFTDAIMDPPHFLEISEEILARQVRVRWRGFGRFDRRFTAENLDKMARAGCSFIIWGMESASNSILKLMKKGTSRDIARHNLTEAANAGIHNRVCLMYGYPTETSEDRDTTLRFLRENISSVHSMAFSPLSVERGTPLAEGEEAQFLDGLSEADGIALELPRAQSPATLDYLHDTEQQFRKIYLELERR